MRRECRNCGRFMGWLLWYGEVISSPTSSSPNVHVTAKASVAEVVDARAEAARSIAHLIGNMLRQVFDFIVARGGRGATDPEISDALNMKPDAVRPRRGELLKSGHVTDLGKTRPSNSGRPMHVWVATGKPLRGGSSHAS